MQFKAVGKFFKLKCDTTQIESILSIATFQFIKETNEFRFRRTQSMYAMPSDLLEFLVYYLNTEVKENPICVNYKGFDYYSVVEYNSISFKLL